MNLCLIFSTLPIMAKKIFSILAYLFVLELNAQLMITGKSDLPEGTSFFVAKKIQSELFPLGASYITNGFLNIELHNITENEILYLIFVDQKNTEIEFISENEKLKFIEKDKFISGGIENKLHYDFFIKTKNLVIQINSISFKNVKKDLEQGTRISSSQYYAKKKMRMKKLYNIVRKTITENPKSFYSYILIEKLYYNNQLTIEEIIDYKSLLDKNFPYNKLNVHFEKEIKENKIPLLNTIIPNHKFIDVNNNEIVFYEKLEKLTLIEFWSANCIECREKIEHLDKIYNKYNKEGFNIIRINTDANTELLTKLIGKNQSKHINVGLKNSHNSVLDSIYNIKSVPSSFLIDSSGKIIARNLVDEELYIKIKEIMKSK